MKVDTIYNSPNPLWQLMSTKIFNGLILRKTTLEQALTKLKTVRLSCVETAQQFVAEMCANKLTSAADLSANVSFLNRGTDPDKISLSSMREECLDARYKAMGKGLRSKNWDYTIDVILIPWEGHVLGLYYLENDIGYRDLLLDAGFADYHYQDSTDRPDDVAKSEWHKRELAWKEALPGLAIPVEKGFSYSLVNWGDYILSGFSKRRITGSMPPESLRRKRIALILTGVEQLLEDPHGSPSKLQERIQALYEDRMPEVLLGEPEIPEIVGPNWH